MSTPTGCQLVEPDPASAGGCGPAGFDPAVPKHPLQRWIERTLLDVEQFVGRALDVLSERIAVASFLPQRLQYHQLQSTGKQVLSVARLHRVSNGLGLLRLGIE